MHVLLFLVVAAGIPNLELVLFRHVRAAAVVVLLLVVAALVARYGSARYRIVPSYDDVDPVAGVLRLN
jgi:hypothetical protein